MYFPPNVYIGGNQGTKNSNFNSSDLFRKQNQIDTSFGFLFFCIEINRIDRIHKRQTFLSELSNFLERHLSCIFFSKVINQKIHFVCEGSIHISLKHHTHSECASFTLFVSILSECKLARKVILQRNYYSVHSHTGLYIVQIAMDLFLFLSFLQHLCHRSCS